jgi:hypothetical protein
VNRRETLAMYRIAVMRQRHQRATAQRQAAAEAAKQHTESTADDCTCPVCTLRRTMVRALAEGVAGVSIQTIDLSPPDRDDGSTKH